MGNIHVFITTGARTFWVSWSDADMCEILTKNIYSFAKTFIRQISFFFPVKVLHPEMICFWFSSIILQLSLAIMLPYPNKIKQNKWWALLCVPPQVNTDEHTHPHVDITSNYMWRTCAQKPTQQSNAPSLHQMIEHTLCCLGQSTFSPRAWKTHTYFSWKLKPLKSNYSIHMEVIVAHEYEMIASPSFNIVRAVWMLLEETKPWRYGPFPYVLGGSWRGPPVYSKLREGHTCWVCSWTGFFFSHTIIMIIIIMVTLVIDYCYIYLITVMLSISTAVYFC